MFLVVNKAPANIVDPATGSTAVFPETGTYFLYLQQSERISYVSSLSLPAKSEIVPIPGELTNIVGGYVGKERNEPLIDEVVPASSFEIYTTSSETYYEAPITLGFTPADGDLIRGTINGVEVNGQWIGRSKYANLYRVGNRDVLFCVIGFHSEKAVISLEQDSAPTTDYELRLYRYVPSGIVQIPQEYVEGIEETTANANEALETATAAQSTANEIKNAVQPADTNNNGIKIKRYIGFKDVLGQYSSPVMPSDINGYIFLRKSSNQNGVNLVIDNGTGGGGTGVCASIGRDGLMLSKNSKIYAPVTPSSYGPIISIYNDADRAYVEFTKDACLVLPSSTPNSTKKFKITVGDDARPTFTDTSNPNNTWTPGGSSRYIINGHSWNYNGANYICTDETPDQLQMMYESGKDIFLDFNEERFKYTGSLFYTIMATSEDNTGIKGAAIAVIGRPITPNINWNCPYKGICNFGVFPFNIQSEG